MRKLFRVAISNPNPYCSECNGWGCKACQYAYWSEAEVRSDYADFTYAWCKDQAEAEKLLEEAKASIEDQGRRNIKEAKLIEAAASKEEKERILELFSEGKDC